MSNKNDPPTAIISGRLERLITEHLGLNPRQFALETKLSPQVVSNLLGTDTEPSGKTLRLILERYPHFNLTWLLTGAGEPFPNGVHGERLPAAPAAPPDVEAALRRARMAEAALAAERAKAAGQETYIFRLEEELNGKKRDGGLDQPVVSTAPRRPTPTGTRNAHRAQQRADLLDRLAPRTVVTGFVTCHKRDREEAEAE